MSEPFLVGGHILGIYRHEHLLGNAERWLVAVHLLHDAIDQPAGGEILDLVDDETLAPDDTSLAHEEHLNCGLQFVFGKSDDVDVLAALGDHLLLLEGTLHRRPPIAQTSGALELEFLRRRTHVGFQAVDNLVGITVEEVAELTHLLQVLVTADVADARPAALLDMEQQARSPEPHMFVELAVAAGTHRKAAQQQVESVANRVRVRIGAEVAHALALPAAHDERPWPLLVERHREKRVALVVAQSDVESRLVLFDQTELEHQRLDLVAHLDPLHGLGGSNHLCGAHMHVAGVLEVVAQPLAKVRCLAHIDDATFGILELIGPRCLGNASGGWALHHDESSIRIPLARCGWWSAPRPVAPVVLPQCLVVTGSPTPLDAATRTHGSASGRSTSPPLFW